MATIEILQSGKEQEKESTVKETVQIEGIQLSRIVSMNDKVEIPIAITDLPNLIAEIEPVDQLQPEEFDSYFALDVPVREDNETSSKKLQLPHHICLRLLLESVLQKYDKCTDVQIRIS